MAPGHSVDKDPHAEHTFSPTVLSRDSLWSWRTTGTIVSLIYFFYLVHNRAIKRADYSAHFTLLSVEIGSDLKVKPRCPFGPEVKTFGVCTFRWSLIVNDRDGTPMASPQPLVTGVLSSCHQ